ncbi:MAG: glycoside hydrolase family 3 C-terminal domain-containing protein [Promethearchaeota archaeon]
MESGKREPEGGYTFRNQDLDLEARVDDLLGRLTVDEKLSLLSGHTSWSTKPIPRLGVPEMKMTDGPHGVGPHSTDGAVCTYFPVGVCRAATWNPALSEEFGRALAQEVRDLGYHVILGPGVNIVRTPLCGRNFEYQTEDPLLNAVLAAAVVRGVQGERVAACVKHYACNNQETWRFWVDAVVSERALREIYLPGFRAAVEGADAWSVMGCYNRVNGKFGCEHDHLVRGVLMGEWGFRGFLVSDWGATNFIEDAAGCVRAGLSLEMPTQKLYDPGKLAAMLAEGKFTAEHLDDDVRRLLRVMFLVGMFDDPGSLPPGSRNTPEHQDIARRVAEEGIVLLKNEGGVLPIDSARTGKLAVLGPNSDVKFSEGGGSSQVRPPHEVTPLEGIGERCGPDIELVDSPAGSDMAVVLVGLAHAGGGDGEGGDRTNFELPAEQVELILKTARANKNTVVVLLSGSPVGMEPWVDEVPALVQAWYPGMEGGRALASVLFGDVNPSGKLPVTFPKRISDSPAHASEETYPGIDDEDLGPRVLYEEGVFVGYRHFDAEGMEPRFPFGHGLSYTSFSYENLAIKPLEPGGDIAVEVGVEVTNVGERGGAEVVQLYIGDVEASVPRPPKELVGFEKLFLEPGEKRALKFSVGRGALSFYDGDRGGWVAEPGTFRVLVGSSSRDIRLSDEFEYAG